MWPRSNGHIWVAVMVFWAVTAGSAGLSALLVYHGVNGLLALTVTSVVIGLPGSMGVMFATLGAKEYFKQQKNEKL